MPQTLDAAFLSVDANQGNGVKTVDAIVEMEGNVLEVQREALPYAPVGAKVRSTLPGKFQPTKTPIFRYTPVDTEDTANDLYPDLLASFDDKSAVTVVFGQSSGTASATNHVITQVGYLMKCPAEWVDGGKVQSVFQLDVYSTTHYDGTTTYTWA